MKKLKVGLLGMGRIGRLHGDNITYFVKNAEIIAAADPMLNSDMEEWAEELGIRKVYDDPMEVIRLPEVEAVFICTSIPASRPSPPPRRGSTSSARSRSTPTWAKFGRFSPRWKRPG